MLHVSSPPTPAPSRPGEGRGRIFHAEPPVRAAARAHAEAQAEAAAQDKAQGEAVGRCRWHRRAESAERIAPTEAENLSRARARADVP